MSVEQMWERLSSKEQTEALSDLNKFYAGEKLGRNPTNAEAIEHYWRHITRNGPRYTVLAFYVSEAVESPVNVAA
jgi:hypothetical protein